MTGGTQVYTREELDEMIDLGMALHEAIGSDGSETLRVIVRTLLYELGRMLASKQPAD